MTACCADAAHGARFALAGREVFVAGRRRATLAADLAMHEPRGVDLYSLDVAAIESAGIALRAVDPMSDEHPGGAGRYVAAVPLAFVSYVRARALFGHGDDA